MSFMEFLLGPIQEDSTASAAPGSGMRRDGRPRIPGVSGLGSRALHALDGPREALRGTPEALTGALQGFHRGLGGVGDPGLDRAPEVHALGGRGLVLGVGAKEVAGLSKGLGVLAALRTRLQ